MWVTGEPVYFILKTNMRFSINYTSIKNNEKNFKRSLSQKKKKYAYTKTRTK